MSQVSYIIYFNKKTDVFTLKSTKDEITVDAKHKKYEWLKGQDAGRIVKISAKGRWNSSKDYYGLYDEINSSTSKKKSTVKSSVKIKVKKSKSIETKPTKSNTNELANLKDTVHHLKDKLDKREKEWRGLLKAKKIDASVINQLKTELSKRNKKIELLESQITQLKKKKALPAKPKPSKPKKVAVSPKKYEAKITANYSFISFYGDKSSEALDVEIVTLLLSKKPTQSFFKAFLKSVAADTSNRQDYKMRKVGIFKCYGIGYINPLHKKRKISGIEIMYIKER